MTENLTSIYNELNALYNCYMILSESTLKKEISTVGMMVLYDKIAELLRHDYIYEILAKDNPYVLEDYVYHVKEDTPEFLSLIKQHLEQN